MNKNIKEMSINNSTEEFKRKKRDKKFTYLLKKVEKSTAFHKANANE